MEGNENSSLNSYYHRHHHTGNAANSGGSNGLFLSPIHHHQQHHHQQNQHHQHHHQQHQHNNAGHYSSTSPEPTPLIFPTHSVTGRSPFGSSPPPPPPTAPSPPPPPPPQPAAETVRRKRGRPRKYGTTETAQNSTSTTKKLSSSSTSPLPSTSLPVSSSSPRNKDSSSVSSPSSSSKKSQLLALGNAGQGFTPHVLTVAAGEDVGQKIMSFMQQKKRAVCILSASGSISNASLRQPAVLGGNVTYEGRYEILSLSGSYLHTEIGGASSRTGGLSICLSGTDGRIVGGGVGGPLKAAGPVQVIVGSFVYNQKDVDIETSESKLPPSMVGPAISSDHHHHLYRLTDNL